MLGPENRIVQVARIEFKLASLHLTFELSIEELDRSGHKELLLKSFEVAVSRLVEKRYLTCVYKPTARFRQNRKAHDRSPKINPTLVCSEIASVNAPQWEPCSTFREGRLEVPLTVTVRRFTCDVI